MKRTPEYKEFKKEIVSKNACFELQQHWIKNQLRYRILDWNEYESLLECRNMRFNEINGWREKWN